jgi:hypothetical protein
MQHHSQRAIFTTGTSQQYSLQVGNVSMDSSFKLHQGSTLEAINLATEQDEPIHHIGQIQPHGVLLALQCSDLKIVQASQNTQTYLGLAPDALLGQPLANV